MHRGRNERDFRSSRTRPACVDVSIDFSTELLGSGSNRVSSRGRERERATIRRYVGASSIEHESGRSPDTPGRVIDESRMRQKLGKLVRLGVSAAGQAAIRHRNPPPRSASFLRLFHRSLIPRSLPTICDLLRESSVPLAVYSSKLIFERSSK